MESKSFDISIEELGGRLRGVIVESERGFLGGLKDEKREEGYSCWNVGRMGLGVGRLEVGRQEVGEESCKKEWVRMLGLPLHLWSREVFIKVGDYCGASGQVLELFHPVVVGSLPKFSMVVPRSCSNGSPELKVKGDDVDGSRAGIGEEDFEGDGRGSSVGRKVYLEGIMGLEGKSGQLEEGSFVLQKAHRVNVLLVGEDGMMRLSRLKRQDTPFIHFLWCFGWYVVLLFFSFLLEKGCKRGPQSCLWLRDVSIHHLSVVLADESVAGDLFWGGKGFSYE
ncbi:hypothetical protein CK203_084375 [Vitis vinifera]|uniref:Uncharacterized protein n=1 Tax=Vitis vinifera TaxID=29760 RepID=A0A438DFC4_VITVI|nr:hypothetical protein CK203_084375 [Vitis vinifera]